MEELISVMEEIRDLLSGIDDKLDSIDTRLLSIENDATSIRFDTGTIAEIRDSVNLIKGSGVNSLDSIHSELWSINLNSM